jgi:hypothetical protein
MHVVPGVGVEIQHGDGSGFIRYDNGGLVMYDGVYEIDFWPDDPNKGRVRWRLGGRRSGCACHRKRVQPPAFRSTKDVSWPCSAIGEGVDLGVHENVGCGRLFIYAVLRDGYE